jgi:hypothetical protein
VITAIVRGSGANRLKFGGGIASVICVFSECCISVSGIGFRWVEDVRASDIAFGVGDES